MFEKVVVPLDGSKLAEVALPYAEELAGKMASEVVLLSVLPVAGLGEHGKCLDYPGSLVDTTRRHIEKYLEKSKAGNIRVNTVTRSGEAAGGILDYVGLDNEAYKLLVMATHGRSGIGRWAIGSVADKVVQATMRQPIMLIRAKGAHPDMRARRILKKVLVPLDGSPRSETVIPYIVEMADRLRMQVTIFRAVPGAHHDIGEAEEYLKCWSLRLADKGLPAKYEVKAGGAAETIIDLADELAVDVVAMATRGQGSFSIWPLGSVAQKVLLGGNTPLLLIRA